MLNVQAKIIKEIAEENNIEVKTFSDDWIAVLSRNGNRAYIYGHTFECNSSATDKILKDKSATYDILNTNNIPAVEHWYPLANYKAEYKASIVDEAKKLLDKYGSIVVKDNQGTCGVSVYKVISHVDLENCLRQLNDDHKKFALSPYYPIDHEYRVVMVYNEPRIIYDKIRPTVIGDGTTPIRKLAEGYKHIDDNIDLDYIPKTGEEVLLSWRHNLSNGATPKIVTDTALYNKLSTLAIQVCQALKINIASVDIIESHGEYKILEINGGLMMENFAQQSEQNYKIVKDIYYDCIRRPLGLPKRTK